MTTHNLELTFFALLVILQLLDAYTTFSVLKRNNKPIETTGSVG